MQVKYWYNSNIDMPMQLKIKMKMVKNDFPKPDCPKNYTQS